MELVEENAVANNQKVSFVIVVWVLLLLITPKKPVGLVVSSVEFVASQVFGEVRNVALLPIS